LFEALFILPAHLGHVSKGKGNVITRNIKKYQQQFAKRFNRFVDKKYRPFLEYTLRHRYITLSTAITLLLIVGAFGYSDHMGMIMMPEVAADEIEAGVSLPVGTTPDQAARVANETAGSERHDSTGGYCSLAR
jgi:Cu/Ag efflux pump CusA